MTRYPYFTIEEIAESKKFTWETFFHKHYISLQCRVFGEHIFKLCSTKNEALINHTKTIPYAITFLFNLLFIGWNVLIC